MALGSRSGMAGRLTLRLVCVLYLLSGAVYQVEGSHEDERKLHSDLMAAYNKYVRPSPAVSTSVNVSVGVTVINIEDLDEKTQTLTANLWLKQFWTDPQLAWNSTLYNGVSSIRMPITQLWVPDITLFNGVGDPYPYPSDILPVVLNSGYVMWIPPVKTRTFCVMDMTRFPYDEHKCTIKFGFWTYHVGEVNVSLSPEHNDQTVTFEGPANSHRAWDLADSSIQVNTRKYDCCAELYADVSLNVTLTRRVGYLNHVFVAPSVIIAFIVPVIFILPVDSGEKITLGSGTLIGQVLLLLMMESFLPSAHPTVPTLGLYYLVNIVLIGFSLVFSAIVSNIWHRGNKAAQVPGIFRMLFLGVLSRLLCLTKEAYQPLDEEPPSMRRLELVTHDDPDSGVSTNEDKAHIMKNYHRQVARSEWRQFAAVVDRLLFVLYVIILLFVTIGLLNGI